MTAKIFALRQLGHFGALPNMVHLPFAIALTLLTGCSQIFSTLDDVSTARTETDYRKLIATNFTTSFKDYNTFSIVEISGPRQVDSMVGRTSMTCVRFEADKRHRVYVYFIRNNAIVDARYDVQTDQCAAQSYEPFDLALYSGKPGPPKNPLY